AGDITALNLEGQGLYYRDARHLSLFEMSVTGTRLTLLSSTSELNSTSHLQFAIDLLLGPDGMVMAEPRTVSINRSRFIAGGLHERVDLCNYNPHQVTLTVRFTLGSDFRDMFDVRGFDIGEGIPDGEIDPIGVRPDGVILSYRRTAGRQRRTYVTFDPAPEHIEIVNPTLRQLSRAEVVHLDHRDEGLVMPPMAAIAFQIELPPMTQRAIAVTITPEAADERAVEVSHTAQVGPERGPALHAATEETRRRYERWRAASTRIETDYEPFDRILRQAELDLQLLLEEFEGNIVPTAGIPWFAVPFGRDSLVTATQTLSLHPAIAQGTLRFLARHQGSRIHRLRGEEPGKILHEIRPGALGEVSESIYYGSIDSTPLFLMALGEYLTWTGDLDFAREILPQAEAALSWIEAYGDPDRDGFVEADRYPARGLGSQAWKDSPDSVHHRDGRLARAPTALAEVQAYVFGAHRHMARIYGLLGDSARARTQRAAADRVRGLFLDRLAMADDEGAFWAMGLDADKQRIETITSNPGHALWCGLLRDDDARQAVRRLMAPDMSSGWGIRTLSSRASTFNPMSYHNGSVWPHDNALIALGMKRAGADAAACSVASSVFEAALSFPGSRLPELWCGFTRDERHRSVPAQYPVGCSPQAWASGSAFMLLQALLGLDADASEGVVRLRPQLPTWLGRISYRRMLVAGSRIDFDVIREGHHVIVEVIDHGGLRIETRQALQD
ncbi:MAG TPA: glycogen debranching N-terminal domain-containing protein, partial [Chloroflexota bacterium]